MLGGQEEWRMRNPVVERSTEDTALDTWRDHRVSGAIPGGARLR
jgi:hypothetical protein